MQPLEQLRDQIDAVDQQLLRLINQRATLAQQVAEAKLATDPDALFYRPEREAQVLRRVREANPGPLNGESVAWLFREIMSACLALEQPLQVACLGPAGTFTEAAARKQFGDAVTLLPQADIPQVLREVVAGNASYGVVPVENSTEGAVNLTLDALVDTPLLIGGEVMLRIHHQLLGRHDITTIRRIYSHSQSFAQCRHWLDQHYPTIERQVVASNAEAARLAAADPESAAIAGEMAASRYQLTTLAAHIEDNPDNTTRFLVLGREPVPPSGRDKTSLLVATRNQPGALFTLLQPLAAHGLSMTRIESRPSRQRLWEYHFFVDLNGHQQEPAVAAALAELSAAAAFCRVLGSYPCAAL